MLALPRGGVPVAAEVASALGASLDLILVRKIGVPMQPELAMGAVVDGRAPIIVRNESVIRAAGVTEEEFDAVCRDELAEIDRRRTLSNPANPYSVVALENARRGAMTLGPRLDTVDAPTEGDLDRAFLALSSARPDAVLVLADRLLLGERTRIAEFMTENRLPSIYTFHERGRGGWANVVCDGLS